MTISKRVDRPSAYSYLLLTFTLGLMLVHCQCLTLILSVRDVSSSSHKKIMT